jgi:transposase-like protein
VSGRLSEISAALDRLSVHELQQLVATAQSRLERRETEALLEERSGLEKHCCHCGSTAVRRWGKTRTQLQRWRCSDCGKTFSSATGTLVERVHRRDGMAAVAKDMMARQPQPCRVLAAALGVDKMTVWRWRTRLLAALGDVGQSGLKGIVEADETYFRESRKGSREWVRHQRAPSRHPKPPRLRWRDYDRQGIPLPRGLSRWQIPVLVTREARRRDGRQSAAVDPFAGDRPIAHAASGTRCDALHGCRRRVPDLRQSRRPRDRAGQHEPEPARARQ